MTPNQALSWSRSGTMPAGRAKTKQFKTGDVVSAKELKAALPARPRKRYHEETLQRNLLEWWLRAHNGLGVRDHRLLFHIPNAAASALQRQILAGLGVRPGVPDMFLAVPVHGRPGLWLELKAGKKGVISPEQRDYHALLRAVGYLVVVPRTLDEAIRGVEGYLRTGSCLGE